MSPELRIEIKKRRVDKPIYYLFSTDEAIMAEILGEQNQNQGLPAGQLGSTISMVQSILGSNNIFGLEEIKKAFPYLNIQKLPDIPFSGERLELAKKLKQFLIYRIDNLSMMVMHENLKDDFVKHNNGKILFDTDWYRNEHFYTTQTQRLGWHLVSWDKIPNSTNKNFLKQTELLVKFLTDNNLTNQTLQLAINEFNQRKNNIQSILTSDWQSAARQLSELQINQLCRHYPVEALYDCLVIFQNTRKRYLEDIYTWTPCLSADGLLVDFGSFGVIGAGILRWKPAYDSGDLGLFFSCSQ